MAKILCVDDDKTTLIALRGMLEAAGYEVVEAPDGKFVPRLLADENPDLLVVDIFMPEKDGIMTIEQIRSENPDLPIIAITSGGKYAMDFLSLVKALGANDALYKPLHADKLLEAVRKLLG
jgi:CheY-like chemotaxis protein